MYGADLAYIHDAGFGSLAEGVAPELIRILRAHGITSGRIVEIGSGSGIVARHLTGAGYDVIGFDRSLDMARLARRNAPKASFRAGSLTRVRLPRAAAVVSIGEVISYVPTSIRPFFERVHSALEPGGLFIFDFVASAVGRTFQGKDFGGRDWALVSRADVDRAGRILTRRMTMFRRVGKQFRKSRETHRITIRSRQEIADALHDAGFRVRMRRAYGRYRLLPGDLAIVAQKL